ncbi:hypothetical protein NUSPORA_02536 [Nucleospora cyclopteri]
MNVQKIKFILQSKKEELFNKANKVVYEGKKQDFYFVDALFRAFSVLGFNCYFDDFLAAIESSDDLLLFRNTKQKYSIVSQRRKVDREKIATIIKSMEEPPEKKIGKKKIGKGEQKIEKGKQKIEKGKQKIEVEQTATFERITKPILTNTNTNNNTSSNNTTKPILTNNNNTKKPILCNLARYEIDDSSDQLLPRKKFKTPFNSTKDSQSIEKHISSFSLMKERIINAFNGNPLLPISSINTAMMHKYGQGFNYKTQPCEIFKHKHGSLKKFLLCCKSFLEIKTFRNCYVYLRTPQMHDIAHKRILTFLVPHSHSKFIYFIETLICNIFSVKVTIPFDDLSFIFYDVYAKKLETILSQPIKKFLLNIKSPNIQLLHSNMNWTVTVIPPSDEAYKHWFDQNIYDEINRLERGGLSGNDISSDHINVSAGQVLLHDWNKKKKSKTSNDRKLLDLLRIADMNVPKAIQNITADSMDDNLNYSNMWKYLRENVNFDNERVFF